MVCFQLHKGKMPRKMEQKKYSNLSIAVLDVGGILYPPFSSLYFPQLAYNNVIGDKSFLNIFQERAL